MIKKFTLFILVLAASQISAQEMASPKPGISINGSSCLILNLTQSCIPRTCDIITVMAGDSIEFCTFQEIYLNTDTAYWMRWHFNGATNLPDTINNNYPSITPICYWSRWDTAGTFIVEVFYNGWLSAYPTSDCYSFGPSHWYVQVNVLPNPNSVAEHNDQQLINVVPNPSSGKFEIQLPANKLLQKIEITDLSGRIVYVGLQTQVDLSFCDPGIYMATIICEGAVDVVPVVIE